MTKQAFVLHAAGSCVLCAIYEGEKDTTINMGTSGRYTHYSTS